MRKRSKMINFRQVEAFRAVMLTGSVTDAGTLLSITQPAATRLIARFEEELGFVLFDRAHNRLIPTAEAENLYHEVKRSFFGLEQIENAAKAIRNLELGFLNIIAAPMFAYGILPRVIGSFHADYPNVRIELSLGQREFIIECIAAQRYDLAIEAPPFKHPGIREQALINQPAICILPNRHRLTARTLIRAEDLSGEKFVSLPVGSMFRSQTDDAFAKAGVERNLITESHTQQSICNLVASCVGVSVVAPVVREDVAHLAVTFRPFFPEIPSRYSLLTPAFRPLSTITSKFIEYVNKSLV
jgi:DNA-binding transcriptional LysR family regulator